MFTIAEESEKKEQLLQLFANMTGSTTIVEPMKKIHGTLRDSDAVEREITLIMRELLDLGIFKTKLSPTQLAKLIAAYHQGKNDTEIARDLGDEKLSKTVARARVRLKLFRDLDFKMPFDPDRMRELLTSDHTMKEISEDLGISPSTLREYRHVFDAQADKAMDAYLERIMDVMEDRDLTEQMTTSATRDAFGDSIDITEAELIDVT